MTATDLTEYLPRRRELHKVLEQSVSEHYDGIKLTHPLILIPLDVHNNGKYKLRANDSKKGKRTKADLQTVERWKREGGGRCKEIQVE